jgi:class 3 adenylate cyclase
MQSVDAWELRGLKIFCLLIGFVASVGLIWQLNNPSHLFIANILQYGGPSLMLISVILTARYTTPRRYAVSVMLAMTFSWLGMTAMYVSFALTNLDLTNGEVVGWGRGVEHAFLNFPSLALLALLFRPLWAVGSWIALCLVIPVENLLSIRTFEQLYFTKDLNVLAVDGNAINMAVMELHSVFVSAFIAGIIGLAIFQRWALKSSIDLEKSKENYRRYFSPEIGDEIENGDLVIGQDGSRLTPVAVLFTDISGFTKLSEKMDPEDILDLLSEYQTLMVDAIFQHKGTVDKFIGDAVMANFGTPRSHGNDAQNAFNCGVLMNRKLGEWNEERQGAGLPVIHHRIGIHFGTCVVGNMGSEQRLEFAVIGDAVNVASRICDACKNFDSNFLISADLASRITHELPSEDVPDVRIRGREETINLVKIYTDG